jgi:hypothetical protein
MAAFGDLFVARVATVGLNPSWQEYLGRDKHELTGPFRRFETLRSLGISSRGSLTQEQCDRAITTMRAYFSRMSLAGTFHSRVRLALA